MSAHFLLTLGHLIGTILGVGGATFIEIHLNAALKDGVMSDEEKRTLHFDFKVTRIGTLIAFITGIGFIVEYYLAHNIFRLADGVFWSKMTIVAIILTNAYLLEKHKIGLYWGSAFSFVSWWAAMVLGTFSAYGIKIFPADTFLSVLSILSVYGVIVALGAQVLHRLRERGKTKPEIQAAK